VAVGLSTEIQVNGSEVYKKEVRHLFTGPSCTPLVHGIGSFLEKDPKDHREEWKNEKGRGAPNLSHLGGRARRDSRGKAQEGVIVKQQVRTSLGRNKRDNQK